MDSQRTADGSPLSRIAVALAGRYSIEREAGTGGMATVYLARDLRHDRKVALKVLHPDLAAALGAERFLAEIRTTANLQHPHILPLHDSGDADGYLFYVMPFVEGETLRARLEREGPLPMDAALRIARETLSALDYAHRHGVIHRDIKPENILLHEDSALVADFGIALAVQSAGGQRMTQTGLSLGTPQYMSPEQAMGERQIDARADIYAAGAVLYEMLTGDPPFTGSTVQAIVAKVMTERPTPPATVRDTVPPHVEGAVLQALAKLPADRFGSAAQFADALDDSRVHDISAPTSGHRSNPAVRRWKVVAGTASVLALVALAIAGVAWLRPHPPARAERYDLSALGVKRVPGSTTMSYAGPSLAIAQDGGRIAFVSRDSAGSTRILLRDVGDLEPRAVAGTEGAESVTLSPDGQSMAFIEGRRLKTVSSTGGAASVLVMQGARAPIWSAEGMIYFLSAATGGGEGISRIPALGGRAELLVKARGGREWLTDPFPLPGGKVVLVTVEDRIRRVAALTLADGAIHQLADGHRPSYVAPGHLAYMDRANTLVLAPFDTRTLALTGPPVPVVERGTSSVDIVSQYAIGGHDALIYMTGAGRFNELVWVGRDGSARSIDSTFQLTTGFPALSPDGSRVSVSRNNSVWIKQLDTGPAINLTLRGGNYAAWTSDGRSVSYFVSDSGGDYHLMRKPADGSTQATPLLPGVIGIVESLWSPDGQWLVYRTSSVLTGAGDIYGFRPGIDSQPRPLVATPSEETEPALSPDGRWLAYTSNETGRHEVYVVPFPNTTGARWVVSTAGGLEPAWSPRGDELFYRDGNARMVSVRVTSGATFALGQSTALFSTAEYEQYEGHRTYDVARNGQRFLMVRPIKGAPPAKVVLVKHWFADVMSRSKAKAP